MLNFKFKILLILVLFSFLTGCANNVAARRMNWREYTPTGQVMNLSDSNFTILGTVRVESRWRRIVFFTEGGITYDFVLAEARKLHPEADAVIDIKYDNLRSSSYFGLMVERTDIVNGIAVKFNKEQRK